jgi:hypothetical protein
MFALWGYLAYDPDLPDRLFKDLLAARYPALDSDKLFEAFRQASGVYPLVTSQFWRPLDFQWIPEFCFGWREGFRHFYTVRDFMDNTPLQGAGTVNIRQWVAGNADSGSTPLRTPEQVAGELDQRARKALELVSVLAATGGESALQPLNDIRSMAHLGRYYAAKIRGAVALARYDRAGNSSDQQDAVQWLEAGLAHWDAYTAEYTAARQQPLFWNRHGWIDLRTLRHDVARDLATAKRWDRDTR